MQLAPIAHRREILARTASSTPWAAGPRPITLTVALLMAIMRSQGVSDSLQIIHSKLSSQHRCLKLR